MRYNEKAASGQLAASSMSREAQAVSTTAWYASRLAFSTGRRHDRCSKNRILLYEVHRGTVAWRDHRIACRMDIGTKFPIRQDGRQYLAHKGDCRNIKNRLAR